MYFCLMKASISSHILSEMAKWGPSVRAQLFIQLANFHQHYLVLVATDADFRYALISVSMMEDSPQGYMRIDDIAWLDVERIHDSVKEMKGELVGTAPEQPQASNSGIETGRGLGESGR